MPASRPSRPRERGVSRPETNNLESWNSNVPGYMTGRRQQSAQMCLYHVRLPLFGRSPTRASSPRRIFPAAMPASRNNDPLRMGLRPETNDLEHGSPRGGARPRQGAGGNRPRTHLGSVIQAVPTGARRHLRAGLISVVMHRPVRGHQPHEPTRSDSLKSPGR